MTEGPTTPRSLARMRTIWSIVGAVVLLVIIGPGVLHFLTMFGLFLPVMVGMEAAYFFFGASTGPLVSVAQSTPAFWLVIAASLGWVLYQWRRHRDRFSIGELIAQVGITYLAVLVTTTSLMSGTHDTADVRVGTVPLYGGLYREAYTARDDDGRRYQVHDAHQVRYGDDGFWRDEITAAQYAALRDYCGAETIADIRHKDQVSSGDGRVFEVDCLHTGRSVVQFWQTPNYLQASRSTILEREGRLPEIEALAKRVGLAGVGYPRYSDGPFGKIEFRRLWSFGTTVEDAGRLDDRLDALALKAGEAPGDGLNPMMLVFATDADAAAIENVLTREWRAPKLGDVLLVVNVDGERAVGAPLRWVRVLAQSDDVAVTSAIEAAVMAQGTFAPDRALDTVAATILKPDGAPAITFVDPEHYAYLTTGYSLGWGDIVWLVVIVLALNWVTTRFFIWFNPVLWVRALRGKT